MTEAEKKAKKKYRDKGKRMTVDFYPSEADLIEQVEKQPNKQGYVKGLIRADMEKPQRHWMPGEDDMTCPVCMRSWNYCDNDTHEFTHCPGCGEKLVHERGGEDAVD